MSNQNISDQYTTTQLFERILETLEQKGLSPEMIQRKHTSAFDEFHVRGREVTAELLDTINLDESQKVLDVGCGLGGPCRMIADTYSCKTTGIDLSDEHIRTATLLSGLTGLAHLTSFIQGNAIHLPFESASFDLALTQHVQMNIEDKQQFYGEIHRVLKPGGKLIYYDVFATNGNTLPHPLPWADHATASFLISTEKLDEHLRYWNFNSISITDQTQKGLKFLTAFLEKAKQKPAILSGQKILMGPNTETKLSNIQRCLSEKRIVLQSGIWEK